MEFFRSLFLSVVVIVTLCHIVQSQSMTNMSAPVIQDPRKDMHLHCKFDMGAEELYAVKWYKDDHEFFRFTPNAKQKYQEYQVVGVTVNVAKTHCSLEKCDLTLTKLIRPHSSGAYRCEVSSEAPLFKLASQTRNITVAVLPDQKPAIANLNERYGLKDDIRASCTSGLGDPKPILTWFQNKEPIRKKFVIENETRVYEQDGLKLHRITSFLMIPAKTLSHENLSNTVEISCVSTSPGISTSIAPPLTSKKTVLIVSPKDLINNQLMQFSRSSTSTTRSQFPLILLILAIFRYC